VKVLFFFLFLFLEQVEEQVRLLVVEPDAEEG